MKVIGAGFGVIILLTIVLTDLFPGSKHTESVGFSGQPMNSSGVPVNLSHTIITGTTDIPMYPGALQMAELKEERVGAGHFIFSTTSSIDDIVEFYERELSENGWVQLGQGSSEKGSGKTAYIDFSWMNPAKVIPLRRYIRISAHEFEGGSDIVILFERWPDENAVPVFPQSDRVEISSIYDPTLHFYERVTTYWALASSADVEDYYKSSMIEHGWSLTDSSSYSLVFSYSRLTQPKSENLSITEGNVTIIDGETRTGSLVRVFLYPDGNKKTRVEIKVGGTEVKSSVQGVDP